MATKAPAKEAQKPAATKEPPKDDKGKSPVPGKEAPKDNKAPAQAPGKDAPKDNKAPAQAPTGKDAPKDNKAPGKDAPKDNKAPAQAPPGKDAPKDNKAPGKDAPKDSKAPAQAPPGKEKGSPVAAGKDGRSSIINVSPAANEQKEMGNFFDSLNNPNEQDHDDHDDSKHLQQAPTDDPKEILKRKNQAEMFKKYLDNTGVSMAFQIIYAEILSKKITSENVFSYTAMRLRQIGSDLAAISVQKQKK